MPKKETALSPLRSALEAKAEEAKGEVEKVDLSVVDDSYADVEAYVRVLDGREISEYLDSTMVVQPNGSGVIRIGRGTVHMVRLALCDAKATRLYGDSIEDIERVGSLPWKVLEAISAGAGMLNKLQPGQSVDAELASRAEGLESAPTDSSS